jgi:hypothetical protein
MCNYPNNNRTTAADLNHAGASAARAASVVAGNAEVNSSIGEIGR